MTNYEEQQAQLLDDYLTALQRNPNAIPPETLDPEMAEFARMMVGDSVESTQETTSQQRVWDDIQATQNIVHFDERTHRMKEKNKNGKRRFSWIPIVATAAATVVLTLLVIGILPTRPNMDAVRRMEMEATQNIIDVTNTAAARQNATATPIASATMTASATFGPTVMPPATSTMDSFQARATQLILDATATALPNNQSAVSTATPDPFMMQATQLVAQATQTASGFSTIPPTAINPGLSCDFEGEFLMYFNQNTLRDSDTLNIRGMIRNRNAQTVHIEIFGGRLTDDEYRIISIFNGLSTTDDYSVTVPGNAYEDGSYLVQIRLLDSEGETLSSCGLPVTFING